MSDLQAKLDTLPPEPTMPHMSASDGVWGDYYHKKTLRDAQLIALAAEWIDDAPHYDECACARWSSEGTWAAYGATCTCERDALLKKLEGK